MLTFVVKGASYMLALFFGFGTSVRFLVSVTCDQEIQMSQSDFFGLFRKAIILLDCDVFWDGIF